MEIDYRRLIRSIGGRRDVWAMLVGSGMKISQRAVDKWSERNSIPSHALVKILLVLKQRGVNIELNDFLIHHAHDHEKEDTAKG